MHTFRVTLVGEPMGPTRHIDATSSHGAVCEAADCAHGKVGAPIWRRTTAERLAKATGTAAAHSYWQQYGEVCYMPRDDSGRQWLVTRADGTLIDD